MLLAQPPKIWETWSIRTQRFKLLEQLKLKREGQWFAQIDNTNQSKFKPSLPPTTPDAPVALNPKHLTHNKSNRWILNKRMRSLPSSNLWYKHPCSYSLLSIQMKMNSKKAQGTPMLLLYRRDQDQASTSVSDLQVAPTIQGIMGIFVELQLGLIIEEMASTT